MRIFSGIIAGIASLSVSSAAMAALTVTATPSATTIGVGESLTVDVVITTDANPSPPNAFQLGEALALGLRAANYDPLVLSGSAVVPAEVLQNPTLTAFGISNVADGSEQGPQAGVRVGTSVNLVQGLSLSPAGGTGPDPAITVTFTGLAAGTTTIDFGVFADYSDAYSVVSGNDNSVTNASVTVTVPEPAAVASSLAALSAIAGVVAVRRRI